jgi:hypothetical protein
MQRMNRMTTRANLTIMVMGHIAMAQDPATGTPTA